MPKLISLTKDLFAIVDDSDFAWLNQFNWFSHRDKLKWYAVRKHDNKQEPMHKTIMNTPTGMTVDHINGNSLDNRRSNLRLATQQEQCFNRKKRVDKCSSRYKGVSYNKKCKLWGAYICKDKKQYHLGYFEDESDAALAYTVAAVKFFGSFASIDFTPEELQSYIADMAETLRAMQLTAENLWGPHLQPTLF